MGIISALFVILLSVSGFIIHHSASLELDQRFTNSAALRAWYSIDAPNLVTTFSSDGQSVSLIADAIYFGSERAPANYSSLIGLIAVDFGFVAATATQMLLFSANGEVIEVLGAVHGVPAQMEAIGIGNNNDVYIRTKTGSTILANLETLEWTFVADEQQLDNIRWNNSTNISEEQLQLIRSDYAGSLLTWDRVILDIHSGRFFGGIGVVLVDIMAILFVLMALSGVWIWSRRRP